MIGLTADMVGGMMRIALTLLVLLTLTLSGLGCEKTIKEARMPSSPTAIAR